MKLYSYLWSYIEIAKIFINFTKYHGVKIVKAVYNFWKSEPLDTFSLHIHWALHNFFSYSTLKRVFYIDYSQRMNKIALNIKKKWSLQKMNRSQIITKLSISKVGTSSFKMLYESSHYDHTFLTKSHSHKNYLFLEGRIALLTFLD